MKKLISLLLAMAIMLGLCACGEPAQQEENGLGIATGDSPVTMPTLKQKDFSNVDENTPVDGVYQIHTAKGLENLAKYPSAKFLLLQDIDLGGAAWTPVENFSGRLDGQGFTVSNFKIEKATAEGNMGFFGTNSGYVTGLNLAQMTVVTTDSTAHAGGLAGSNSGTLENSGASGTLTVANVADSASCGGAVGENSGNLSGLLASLDMECTAAGKANLGSLAGSATGGKITACDATGKLQITGDNKTVGLLAGTAKNVEFDTCVFLGAANHIDGKLFDRYFGKAENATATGCLRRDNTREQPSAEIRALRDKAVQAMYEMGTVVWTVKDNVKIQCFDHCKLSGCTQELRSGLVYRGLPYRHNTGGLARMMYCLDENNYVEDWAAEVMENGGLGAYMGSDCLRSAQMAWASVANSFNIPHCMAFVKYPDECGAIIVGLPKWTDIDAGLSTTEFANRVGIETVYEAYAQMWAADALVRVTAGGSGHGMMAATDPVVVRDDEGKIDPDRSYVYIHEQGRGSTNPGWITTWSINRKSTFTELAYGDQDVFLPYTILEFKEGEKDVPTATLEGGTDGRLGLITGVVKSNFYMDSVTMVITDSWGKEVFNRTMFTRVEYISDFTQESMLERVMSMEYDLAGFSYALQEANLASGKTYHATITADLYTGDHIVVKDFEF